MGSARERACAWVDERKYEADDGRWWIVEPDTDEPDTDDPTKGPFQYEAEIDKALWDLVPADLGADDGGV